MRRVFGEPAWSRTLLAAIALAVAAALLLSDRPVGLTDMMRIEEIAILPDSGRLEPVRRYTMIGSGLIPYMPGEPAPPATARPPIKLGWVYREISGLRMPFFAASQFGPVTFVELAQGRQYALMGPEQLAELDARAGRAMTAGYSFQWYKRLWGWLIVFALIGWTLLRRREERIREDLHWAS